LALRSGSAKILSVDSSATCPQPLFVTHYHPAVGIFLVHQRNAGYRAEPSSNFDTHAVPRARGTAGISTNNRPGNRYARRQSLTSE